MYTISDINDTQIYTDLCAKSICWMTNLQF